MPPDCLFRHALSDYTPSLLGQHRPRVQGRQSVKAEKPLSRTMRAIFVRDPEPVPFEATPVRPCEWLPPMWAVTKDDPASVRPSHGLDVIRPHAYAGVQERGGKGHGAATHSVRGLRGIVPCPLEPLSTNTQPTLIAVCKPPRPAQLPRRHHEWEWGPHPSPDLCRPT